MLDARIVTRTGSYPRRTADAPRFPDRHFVAGPDGPVVRPGPAEWAAAAHHDRRRGRQGPAVRAGPRHRIPHGKAAGDRHRERQGGAPRGDGQRPGHGAQAHDPGRPRRGGVRQRGQPARPEAAEIDGPQGGPGLGRRPPRGPFLPAPGEARNVSCRLPGAGPARGDRCSPAPAAAQGRETTEVSVGTFPTGELVMPRIALAAALVLALTARLSAQDQPKGPPPNIMTAMPGKDGAPMLVLIVHESVARKVTVDVNVNGRIEKQERVEVVTIPKQVTMMV